MIRPRPGNYNVEMLGDSILVVEDTPVNLKLMRLLLGHEGYKVRTAESAEEALSTLQSFRPKMILADIQLPGMDGLEMTRKIKADPKNSGIKIVALTAFAMSGDKERALQAGCDGYIAKPIDTHKLASEIREMLQSPVPELPNEVAISPLPARLLGVDLSGPELDSLRERFLKEGRQRSEEMLATLPKNFDAAQACREFHRWVGSAGVLRFQELSALARTGEELLRSPSFDMSEVRECLSALAVEFSALHRATQVPIPAHVLSALKKKRIGLVGFIPERADYLCGVLERVEARARLFEISDSPSSETVRQCEIVIVNVRPETVTSEWLQASGVPGDSVLVLSGDRQSVVTLPLNVQAHSVEFLVDGCQPDEVLLRLTIAMSRKKSVLPTADRPASAPSRPAVLSSAAPISGALKVLVADDDPIILTVVGSNLRNFGMECRCVKSGDEALQLIREGWPQVAVLDVNMPEFDGYQVLAAARKEALPVQIILLTARQQEDDVLRGFQLGAEDYLTKPFSPLELVARVKRVVKR